MPRHRPTRHLVVFARSPRLGTGKRRLAAAIGTVQALRVARVLLRDTLRRVGRDARWRLWLAVTPDRAALRIGTAGRRAARRGQGRGDLGSRMGRLFRPPPIGLPLGPVVIVGADIPGIGAGAIARAFAALDRAAVVLAPAADGGYWLVGARRRPRPPAGLFDGVRWSGPWALADTLANAGRDAIVLDDRRDDIDTGADLARWRRRGGRL